ANRLLRRVRDFAEVRGDGTIDATTAKRGLSVFGVDDRGLDKVDRAVLSALCEQFRGGPVGLSTLAISVGEQTETVEDVYEPFLIQQGLLARTPRGRIAMPDAWHHLGLDVPPNFGDKPPSLFS
ncbi:MAG: Holliday junction DNA helicase RuvB C-terminal domain-containing protein, partial [Ilumatobacteraceae bacterium]